jgi:DNA-binding NtrC family response regulator
LILLIEGDPLLGWTRLALLERQFEAVCRVGTAAEALCLIEQPAFASRLCLVISSHTKSDNDGPAFVAELVSRMPEVPVLVLGDVLDGSDSYQGEKVTYLPGPYVSEQICSKAKQMLRGAQSLTA